MEALLANSEFIWLVGRGADCRPTLDGRLSGRRRCGLHHLMNTYITQTRDQYMPGAPSRKARQSRSTAAGSKPAVRVSQGLVYGVL